MEEETSVSDTRKRSKHDKKKNEMDDMKENSLRLNEKVEEKKRKKKHVVLGDIIIDSATFSEDGNGKGCEQRDGDVQKENDLKRKKKNKRKLEAGEVVSDFKDGLPTLEQNVVEFSENENSKQKKEKRVICGVVENDKDKIHTKKKRKIDHVGVEDPVNNESQMEVQNEKKSIEKEKILDIKNAEEGPKEKRSKKEKKMKAQDGKYSVNIKEESVKDDDGAIAKKNKKKKKVDHHEDKNADEDSLNNDEAQGEGNNGHKTSEKLSTEKEKILDIKNGVEGSKKKSRKEKNMKAQDGKDSGNVREENVINDDGAVEKKRKKKKKVDHDKDKNTDEDTLNNDEVLVEGDNLYTTSIKQDTVSVDNNGEEGSKEKKKKKEKKKIHQEEENAADNNGVGQKKRKKGTEKNDRDSEDPKPKAKRPKKKVRFSGDVEVFPTEEEKLLRGKRFSKEEDEKVKEAVHNYIAIHNLGGEGLNKVLNCRCHPELKNCWKEIGTAIPYRPFKSIYYRAHILFERDETRKWTEEEKEFIMKAQEKYGNNWKLIADELGKHRFHVKDTWRRIKLPNKKKGHWSQDEYQTLFDLVNTDLQMKASEEKKSKHGMLRDNICWGAISDKLSTRTNQNCCLKWYAQLSSPMVHQGIWADADDYRLLDALFNLDACCIEDVDWDMLIEHRSGDVCRKRWDQMVLHIGQHGLKSFSEQVDILAKRYCPDLAEVREEWDNKPVVD